jgi:hypothetical protein
MHQLPDILSQVTPSAVTAWIWGASFLLQITLLIAVFRRRIAGSFPFFTTFIGFYLIRSVLLYILFDYVSIERYNQLYNFLLLFDILVQIGLAAELCAALVRAQGGWTANRLLYSAGGVLLASFATWIAVLLMPHAGIRLDRSQMFFSIVAILLFLTSLRSSNDILRAVALGWGIFGIVSFAADIGRVFAAAGNHPGQYAIWSYALAAAYLIIVAFWIVALRAPATGAPTSHSKPFG